MLRKRNGLRIMLREKLMGQHSKLKMYRQWFNKCGKIWSMLISRYWRTDRPKLHLTRCWFQSDTVCVMLQVLSMVSKRSMRMMKRLSRANSAKMTIPAGWWVQSTKQLRRGRRGFTRCRWSLMKWWNQDGRMKPDHSVNQISSTTHPNWGFRHYFKFKHMRTLPHLHRQHVQCLRCVLTSDTEYRKCYKGRLGQEIATLC